MLFAKDTPGESIVVRGARVVDPVEGVDAMLDVRLDDGVIAALGQNLDTNSHRVIDGEGLVLAPAFVDPHVHLRVPGQEHKEDIETGSRSATACSTVCPVRNDLPKSPCSTWPSQLM